MRSLATRVVDQIPASHMHALYIFPPHHGSAFLLQVIIKTLLPNVLKDDFSANY